MLAVLIFVCNATLLSTSGVIIKSKGQDTILQFSSTGLVVKTDDPYFPGTKITLGCMYAPLFCSHFRNTTVVGDSCDLFIDKESLD
jgi:hypothetical protein